MHSCFVFNHLCVGNLTALRDNKNFPRLFRRQFILIRNNYKDEVGPFHLCTVFSAVRVTVFKAGGERQQTWFPSVPSAVNAVSSFEFQMGKVSAVSMETSPAFS